MTLRPRKPPEATDPACPNLVDSSPDGDYLFGAYKGCQRMVRDERFKLIKYNAGGVKNTQLFDLANDPDEVHNLAADPKHADQLARMEKLLAQARKEFNDPIDFDGKGELPEKYKRPKRKVKAKPKAR